MQRARALLESATRRTLDLPERGVALALLEWGERGPLLLLHHANGFCKGVFGLVAEGLREGHRVVAMDARGHGDSSVPEGPKAYAWDAFALDAAAVAEHLAEEAGEPLALGLGHSFGGTSVLGAAARRPDLFRRLVLVDPVIPPREPVASSPERAEHLQALVDGARKRRSDWPSRQEARAWYAERELFAGWRPEALDLYVLDGLRERADGSVELKCAGEVEAAVFGASAGFDLFARVRGAPTPTRILWAARGSFPRPLQEELAASLGDARVEPVDAGHLVPMERPDLVEAAVRRSLEAGA